jgi:hypothetical protein
MSVLYPRGERSPQWAVVVPHYPKEITMKVPKEEIQMFVKNVEAMSRDRVANAMADAERLRSHCQPGSEMHEIFSWLLDYLERRLATLDAPPPAGPS